ncbi:hypothetical protein HPB49_005578 [Dermacentor silvarum]|uniref:Uncharacterized protein n=1 Tax=Dermacentor silvarum TaxID=543639 RepID=A0ACB8DWI0_DERSI|nr:hypothetical protein HPB49_005578 [Dermacentor silvarum]
MAVGKLPEFDSDSGSLDAFIERLELYTTAKEVAEAKKMHPFLIAIGGEAYVTLRSLNLPKTPNTPAYKEVVSTLQMHYSPRRSVVKGRYYFNQTKQAPKESVTSFVVQL